MVTDCTVQDKQHTRERLRLKVPAQVSNISGEDKADTMLPDSSKEDKQQKGHKHLQNIQKKVKFISPEYRFHPSWMEFPPSSTQSSSWMTESLSLSLNGEPRHPTKEAYFGCLYT